MGIWKVYFKGIYFGTVRGKSEIHAKKQASELYGGHYGKYSVYHIDKDRANRECKQDLKTVRF
jgi:hypothetical protein